MVESITKEEEEGEGERTKDAKSAVGMDISRKEKRKEMKKMKRRQLRKQMAEKEREQEEAKLNDPEEQRRAMEMEEEEKQRMERDRKEFEEREKKWLEEMEKKRKEEEEEERRRALEEEEESKRLQVEQQNECDEDWEYVEEGPAEIIWKGNEIIVRKKRVKVPKQKADEQSRNEISDRPTSNPLPPQSKAFADYHSASMASAEQLLENVAQQVPNFGTEQDKAHCPFHLKTGVCRFGQRCSRVHFYPDKACTLLMKNMYNGHGLAWELDEGLEYTDEEIERCYEEFYEDVHTEFLKYGEIVNFKVCKNSSLHLRGNVYVQYKSLDSAVLAYHSFNGRYFAGKQVQCEYINLIRWKVAICGEYMKSRHKECSRGAACNFIHCFRNPCGDYEWADWDKPPPRFWVKKMAALFGYSDESKHMDREKSEHWRMSSRQIQSDTNRVHSTRSRSSGIDYLPSPGNSDHGSHDSNSDIDSSDRDFDVDTKRNHHQKLGASLDNRDREKNQSHKERSPRHQGKVRSVDNFGDGKEFYREKGRERRIHPRKKSSIHQSNFSDDHWDDRYRTHDPSDELDKERYQSYNKRRHSKKTDQHASDDEDFGGKRLKKNYREEAGTGKSHLKRKKTDGDLSIRSHSSRKSIERNSDVESFRTKENHHSRVDHYSSHNHIEQDRWKPNSSE